MPVFHEAAHAFTRSAPRTMNRPRCAAFPSVRSGATRRRARPETDRAWRPRRTPRRSARARRDAPAEFTRPARREGELLTHRALFGLRALVRFRFGGARARLLGLLCVACGLVDLPLAVARLLAFGLEPLRRLVFRRPRALSLCALRRPRALAFEACAGASASAAARCAARDSSRMTRSRSRSPLRASAVNDACAERAEPRRSPSALRAGVVDVG